MFRNRKRLAGLIAACGFLVVTHALRAQTCPTCDDGKFCTTDFCSGGACTNIPDPNEHCDDGDPCSIDVCRDDLTGGPCEWVAKDDPNCTSLVPPGLASHCCDSGEACNSLGQCVQCQVDSDCSPGVCLNGVCVDCRSDAHCDDGNLCNGQETCVSNVCQAGDSVDCSNLNGPCRLGVCSEAFGCIPENFPNGTACDDGDRCTAVDTCQTGVCVGGANPDACVRLEFRPPQLSDLTIGQTIELDLFAVAEGCSTVFAGVCGGTNHPLIGLDAILSWSPAVVRLLGNVDPCDPPGSCDVCEYPGSGPHTYNWSVSSFPVDDTLDSVNIPNPTTQSGNDGDAYYTAFNFCVGADPACASPYAGLTRGLWVTSFQFEVLAELGAGQTSSISLMPCVEGGFTKTRAVSAVVGVPNFETDVTKPLGECDSVGCDSVELSFRSCEPPTTALAVGCRYVEVTPPPGTEQVALEVRGDPNNSNVACMTQYVQAPTRECIGGSNPGTACTSDGDCTNGLCFTGAVLGPSAVRLTPAEWGTVNVRAAEIQPSTLYEWRSDCGAVAGQTVSDPVSTTMWAWGDTDHSAKCSGGTNSGNPCKGDADCPGEGTCLGVDFRDISKVVDGFKSLFSASLTMPSVDLWGSPGNCRPQVGIDFVDIGAVVDAWKIIPFDCASPCP